jgi:hypothetical protein
MSLLSFLYIDQFEVHTQRTQIDSYNTNTQKYQYILPTIHPFILYPNQLCFLLKLIFVDFTHLTCNWIPFTLFKQIKRLL